MKTNVKIELTDDERNRLAILFDGGKQSKRMATRKDIVSFVDACLDAALEADPNGNGPKPDIEVIGDAVIHDINAGGWSFIGE